jgi:hypothetical protein
MNTSDNKWYKLFFFSGGNVFLGGMLVCLILSSVLGAMTPMKIADLSKYYGDKELYYQTLKSLGTLFIGVYFNRVFYQYCTNRYIFKLMGEARTKCFENWLMLTI